MQRQVDQWVGHHRDVGVPAPTGFSLPILGVSAPESFSFPLSSPAPNPGDHSPFYSNSTATSLNQASITTHLDYSSRPLTSLPDSFLI